MREMNAPTESAWNHRWIANARTLLLVDTILLCICVARPQPCIPRSQQHSASILLVQPLVAVHRSCGVLVSQAPPKAYILSTQSHHGTAWRQRLSAGTIRWGAWQQKTASAAR